MSGKPGTNILIPRANVLAYWLHKNKVQIGVEMYMLPKNEQLFKSWEIRICVYLNIESYSS